MLRKALANNLPDSSGDESDTLGASEFHTLRSLSLTGERKPISEPAKRITETQQCFRCQGFDHTQYYSKVLPKCVKCAGAHHLIECKKDENKLHKCVNCDDEHPASYRGCLRSKVISQKQFFPIRNKK